jgi:hypothetical protein
MVVALEHWTFLTEMGVSNLTESFRLCCKFRNGILSISSLQLQYHKFDLLSAVQLRFDGSELVRTTVP